MPSYPMKSLVETDWNLENSLDGIRTAALVDIARSVRVVASNYQGLINDRDTYKRWWKEEEAKREARDRQIISLRGVITKLKRKAGAA